MLAPRTAESGCPQTPGSREAGGSSIARARHEARVLLARERLATPRSAFRIHPVKEMRGDVLDFGTASLSAPPFATLSKDISSVAAAACTLGAAVEERVSGLFKAHEPLLAMALDQLATEMLFALSDRLYAAIRREGRRHGLHAGSPESPGDSAFALEVQATVLALAGLPEEVVSANSRGMLRPVKSLSFIVPLGARLPARSFLPRCLRCASREGCRVRPQ